MVALCATDSKTTTQYGVLNDGVQTVHPWYETALLGAQWGWQRVMMGQDGE